MILLVWARICARCLRYSRIVIRVGQQYTEYSVDDQVQLEGTNLPISHSSAKLADQGDTVPSESQTLHCRWSTASNFQHIGRSIMSSVLPSPSQPHTKKQRNIERIMHNHCPTRSMVSPNMRSNACWTQGAPDKGNNSNIC
jgi:hypothetical protein